jgi:hypothetical protein
MVVTGHVQPKRGQQAWQPDETEVEVYRGYHWSAYDSSNLPNGINWGPEDNQTYGITDLELNPFQSFSADINISQGTTSVNGFAGAGFANDDDYTLLIGAKVPADRILGTAQTGFGAKLESEIVVMGRAQDTVAYRAGTRVESTLQRQAIEQWTGSHHVEYTRSDGVKVHVSANPDKTYTITYHEGPHAKLGGQTYGSPEIKLGASKTYKTAASINKMLKAMRIANTYVAPTGE